MARVWRKTFIGAGLAVALVCATALAAGATISSEEDEKARILAQGDPVGGLATSDLTFGSAQERAEELSRDFERMVESDAAEAERSASRQAFTELAPAEAIEVVEDEFGMGQPLWAPPEPSRGAEVVSRTRNTIVIDEPGPGGRVLVESSIPLLTPGADPVPVALELESQGSALGPRDPLVETEISKEIAGGVTVGVSRRPTTPPPPRS